MKNKVEEMKLSARLHFEVCDLLRPVDEKIHNWADLVFDKGTLDAILP